MSKTIKPFAEQGNYISMHRVLFDDVMPILSPNAWKVLCFLVRKTIGWQKEFDVISYSQIQTGTGIKNRSTVSLALHELQGQEPIYEGKRIACWLPNPNRPHLINAYKGERRRDGTVETTCYCLDPDFSIEPSPENGLSATESRKRTDNNSLHISNSREGKAADYLGSNRPRNYRDESNSFDFDDPFGDDD